MNALQYESDIDFYNSRLTREQLLARAIVDAEAPTDILEDFWESYVKNYAISFDDDEKYDCAMGYSTHYYKEREEVCSIEQQKYTADSQYT